VSEKKKKKKKKGCGSTTHSINPTY